MDELTNFLIDFDTAVKLERRGFHVSGALKKNKKHVVAYYSAAGSAVRYVTSKPIVDYALVQAWLHDHNIYPCAGCYTDCGFMGWAVVEQDGALTRRCVVQNCEGCFDALLDVIDQAIDLIPPLAVTSDSLPF